MIFLWTIVFLLSLVLLVKGADWLISSAEKIGLSIGLSPFIIGVTIVGLGTSFPELITAFIATIKGETDFAVANAVGSNIVNILLVVGLSALIGRKLVVTKSLIDIDLPLLAIGTVLFLGIVWDKQVTFGEAFLMFVTYGSYLLYTVFHKEEEEEGETLPSRKTRREKIKKSLPEKRTKDFSFLLIGSIFLLIGAKYLIDSLIEISTILGILPGVITVTAVSLGTSLPELFVSVKAALNKKAEVALGNIFGSNVFNMLVVVGLPGMFFTLSVDDKVFYVAVPTMALATVLFIVSGISKKIHMWEGMFYLSLYILFISKMFDLF